MEDFKKMLEELEKEEQKLQFTHFTNKTAYQVGILLVDAAMNGNLPVTIDICRGEQQLFHYALPGTSKDNDEWIKRKNRVVNRFSHSSYYMGIYYKTLNTTIKEKSLLDPSEYAPYGGAFPIIIQDVGVVGTITVSGLPQKEDHQLVVKIIKEFLQIEA
jgi:uncharacterized protein (UPF0303 family)